MFNNTNRRQSTEFTIGSINICGMSERSKFVLDNYVNKKAYDFMAVQELETSDLDQLKLTNMTVITDCNRAANKGAALYANSKFSLTPLPELSQISPNIDSSWGLAVIGSKRYIIASVYLKLNHPQGIQEIINMMTAAEGKSKQLRSSGIIVIGDFNARHTSWGDKLNNDYGKQLVEKLDYSKFSICTSPTPTFLAANGSSVIDLMIVSNNITDNIKTCVTDEHVELYSGAPLRGHVPLIATIATGSAIPPTEVIEKICLKTVNWEDWSRDIELTVENDSEMVDSLVNPHQLWNYIDESIQRVTLKHCSKKKSTVHSKPYWTPTLTSLSKKLRDATKSYMKRNTDPNKEKMEDAKLEFDTERKKQCQEFIISQTKNLNSAQSKKFWKKFNCLFKIKSDNNIDPLSDGKGGFHTDHGDMDNLLFSTFFEGAHLNPDNFDEEFYNTVNNLYDDIKSEDVTADETDPEHEESDPNNILNSDITLEEIKQAMKNTQSSGKSFDNHDFNPVMLKHLGPKILKQIHRLFNLCLKNKVWVWNDAEVIFLKKEGKGNYSLPGSYRPISISSYIGKLLEKILAKRLLTYLQHRRIYDPDQEGFTIGRNTIRYLNRLHLGIKADIEKKLSILCLFIDFEKAFDSVWKRGLIHKLFKIGVKGNILMMLDNFLFSRKVALKINGVLRPNRMCMDYGLPQGSALSPILFKIFLLDIAEELTENPDIEVYKFADDGTIKVRSRTTENCLITMEEVLGRLKEWTRKWRMIINCQPNKTEMMCFGKAEGKDTVIPESFQLGDKHVKLVPKTKVLGLIIDEQLSYNPHSNYVHNKILGRWANICKYSNKHWGLCQRVMVQLMRTLFISCICYAGHIWIKPNNTNDINKVWYKIIKSSVGAVFNIRRSLAEIILGIPPLQVLNKINRIKHYLKINLCPTPGDRLLEFIKNCNVDESNSPIDLCSYFKEVYRFLRWKLIKYPEHFTQKETVIIANGSVNEYCELSPKSCSYTKVIIDAYTEKLWENSITNEYQLEGHYHHPTPRCSNLPIPRNTTREEEVKLMSCFYTNNLFENFLFSINKAPSPLCNDCKTEEHSPYHVIINCPNTDVEHRLSAKQLLVGSNREEMLQEDTVTLLNGSRNVKFINVCLKIINSASIRDTIVI